MNDDRVAARRAVLLTQHRVVRAIEVDLAAAGAIPLSHSDVLLELDPAPDRRLRMQDLGERVALARSRVSRLVDELESHGPVERLPDQDDGRACHARLTADGRTAFRRAAPHDLSGIEQQFTSHLSARERTTITVALEWVVATHVEP